MDNQIDKFKEHLLINGRSYSTIKSYTGKVKEFLKTVGDSNLEDAFKEFVLKMRDNKKPATINVYINAVKSYSEFLGVSIRVPDYAKLEKKLPDSFDEQFFEDEIVYIIEQISPEPIKMKAILYFLYYSGLRIGELDLIKRKDFDLDNNTVRVYISKTREERIVYYPDKVKDILKLFFDLEPEDSNAFNMSSLQIQNYFYTLKPHFKDINFRPHLFRHSYATTLIRRGMNLATVSKLLGHHNIQSTMKYIGLSSDEEKEDFLNIWKKKDKPRSI